MRLVPAKNVTEKKEFFHATKQIIIHLEKEATMPAEQVLISTKMQHDVDSAILKPYRASVPGPVELCIKDCKVLDKRGQPVRVVQHGDEFYLVMDIYHSELLGDLEVDYRAEFHVMNLASCGSVQAYCTTVESKLKCNTTFTRIRAKFQCTERGVFTYAATIYLPHSELFDFCCFEECFACQPIACHEVAANVTVAG